MPRLSYETMRRSVIGKSHLLRKYMCRSRSINDYHDCVVSSLYKAIVSSAYVLGDLRNFNEKDWTVRYPSFAVKEVESPERHGALLLG